MPIKVVFDAICKRVALFARERSREMLNDAGIRIHLGEGLPILRHPASQSEPSSPQLLRQIHS
jgi:hypothetical protein